MAINLEELKKAAGDRLDLINIKNKSASGSF
jgi:hypothetical protein